MKLVFNVAFIVQSTELKIWSFFFLLANFMHIIFLRNETKVQLLARKRRKNSRKITSTVDCNSRGTCKFIKKRQCDNARSRLLPYQSWNDEIYCDRWHFFLDIPSLSYSPFCVKVKTVAIMTRYTFNEFNDFARLWQSYRLLVNFFIIVISS